MDQHYAYGSIFSVGKDHFQGLRHYKEKFGPVWTPRYLASPGGLALPVALLDVTALVAGGVRAIVSKRRRAR